MRRNLSILAATVLTGGLVSTMAAPSNASGYWAVQDNFETNASSVWNFSSSGNGFGDFGGYDGTAHSGTVYATIYRFTAGWSAVGRTVHLTPMQLHTATCQAQIYLQDWAGTQVNFEVINPSTWTYVALKPITIANSNWNAYQVGPWTGGPTDVYVRVAVGSTGGFARVKVDDLTVACTY